MWGVVDKANFLNCSENRDPVVKILGPSFATVLEGEDNFVLRLVDKVKQEDQAADSALKVKLFFLLQHLDNQLLSNSLKKISQ